MVSVPESEPSRLAVTSNTTRNSVDDGTFSVPSYAPASDAFVFSDGAPSNIECMTHVSTVAKTAFRVESTGFPLYIVRQDFYSTTTAVP